LENAKSEIKKRQSELYLKKQNKEESRVRATTMFLYASFGEQR
jgi:hypothetical protein